MVWKEVKRSAELSRAPTIKAIEVKKLSKKSWKDPGQGTDYGINDILEREKYEKRKREREWQ